MGSEVHKLKQQIIDEYPDDEPHWEAFGRIRVKTGVDMRDISEDDTVDSDTLEELKQAAAEVTGANFA